MKDLVRLCKEFNININLPGNTSYDPRKPEATELIEDFFPQKIAARCGLPNAFTNFKLHERECLELYADLRAEIKAKRDLEREKAKLATILHLDGI